MPTHGAAHCSYSVNTAPRALSDVTPVTRMKLGFSCRSLKVLELLSVVENIGGGAVYTPTCVHTGCFKLFLAGARATPVTVNCGFAISVDSCQPDALIACG